MKQMRIRIRKMQQDRQDTVGIGMMDDGPAGARRLMRRWHLVSWLMVLVIALLALDQQGQAQNRPVTSTLQITPPYSVYLADYARPGSEQMQLYLLLRDLTEPAYDVRLRLTIEGSGIRLQTDPNFLPPPITLEGGSPLIVSGQDLAPYLDSRHLLFSGITRQAYEERRALPEGFYQFSVEVLDYRRSDRVLSRAATFMAWLTLNEPPRITAPICGSTQPLQEPQHLLLQWIDGGNASVGSLSTEYELTLVEVFPQERNVEDAIRSSVPLLQTVTTQTSYLYGLTDAALIPGQKYALRVRAIDTEGRAMFKNQGYSEVCSFTYAEGDPLAPPDGIRIYAEEARKALVNWHLAITPESYRVQYRRKADQDDDEADQDEQDDDELSWFSLETTQEQVVLRDLEPETSYEVRVASLFSGTVSRYSSIESFTTPALTYAACGAAPPPPITASTIPLTTVVAGQYWQVGDFRMQVRQVRGGDGVYSGWGVMEVPYLGVQLPVKFEKVWVDEEYNLVRGEVIALSEGVDGFRQRWQQEESDNSAVAEGQDGSSDDEPVEEIEVATVTVEGEVVEVYVNEGQVVAVDQEGNEEVVAEEVPEEGQALAVTDSNGNSFTVDSGGSVSNNGSSNSDASLAAHALEQRLLSELLEDFDQNIALWLENHEKGPLDEQMLRLLQELPPCLPAESEELVTIHQHIERLQADIAEAWNALSEESQQWFSAVVEALSAEDSSLTEQLSEEEAQRAEEIVCELLTEGNNSTFVLQLFEGETQLEEDAITLITTAPSMPDIRARVEGAVGEYELKLVIEYLKQCTGRGVGRTPNQSESFPVEGWHKLNAGEEWDIDLGTDAETSRPKIRGGIAHLVVRAPDEASDTIRFFIKGQNPTVTEVNAFVNQAPYNQIWFFKKILFHESGTPNNLNGTVRQFNVYSENHESLSEDNWNAWSRMPNFGAPCGWGLMQLDNPAPPAQALWDWKANVIAGYELLTGEKKDIMETRMSSHMQRVNIWNGANPTDLIEGHIDREEGGVTYVHGSSNHFQNTEIESLDEHFNEAPGGNERSFLEASWIKTYNGLGSEGRIFYYIQQGRQAYDKPEWRISNTATYGTSVNHYVESIGEQQTP